MTNVALPTTNQHASVRARWSDYHSPKPATIVNVTTEDEVAATIKHCTQNRIPFLAQNGGGSWAKTTGLGPHGVLINLSLMNAVTFSDERKQATVGGGATVKDAVDAAHRAGAILLTGGCNVIGMIGAYLGGGYGNLIGEMGMGVDTILSLRVVLANGAIVTASATSHPDLFWAMRGAGPNFGIVVSMTVTTMPASPEESSAYIGNLFFSGDKIERVARAVQELELSREQRVFFYLAGSGPSTNEPFVIVNCFLHKGTEETGRAAFASLHDIGPVMEMCAVESFKKWNGSGDIFCVAGGRKPGCSTSIRHMHVEKWPEIWEMYTRFQAKAPDSAILIERFNMDKAREVPEGSVAWNEALRRDAFAQAIVIPWYEDEALDAEAEEFAKKVRGLWCDGEDPKESPVYVNFAHGDETQEAVYGSSLPRLKELKRKYDPTGVFNQWFPITP